MAHPAEANAERPFSIPPELREKSVSAFSNVLPERSKERYLEMGHQYARQVIYSAVLLCRSVACQHR